MTFPHRFDWMHGSPVTHLLVLGPSRQAWAAQPVAAAVALVAPWGWWVVARHTKPGLQAVLLVAPLWLRLAGLQLRCPSCKDIIPCL